jgi:hypothetical protein
MHTQSSLHQRRLSVQLCKRLKVGRETLPRMKPLLAAQVVQEESVNLKFPKGFKIPFDYL